MHHEEGWHLPQNWAQKAKPSTRNLQQQGDLPSWLWTRRTSNGSISAPLLCSHNTQERARTKQDRCYAECQWILLMNGSWDTVTCLKGVSAATARLEGRAPLTPPAAALLEAPARPYSFCWLFSSCPQTLWGFSKQHQSLLQSPPVTNEGRFVCRSQTKMSTIWVKSP